MIIPLNQFRPTLFFVSDFILKSTEAMDICDVPYLTSNIEMLVILKFKTLHRFFSDVVSRIKFEMFILGYSF